MPIIRHSQVISWCLSVGSKSIGLKQKAAKEVFFVSFFKSACSGLFLLPESKKIHVKEN